jgi:hypothetical protein
MTQRSRFRYFDTIADGAHIGLVMGVNNGSPPNFL